MDLRKLRYFLALADTRHFGRAAEQLHLSQPGLSQQIKQFERELGVTLVDRTTTPITLTDAGALLQEQGAQIEQLVDHTVRQVKSIAAQDRPVLRIAHARSANALIMRAYDIVDRFTSQHPGIEVISVASAWTTYNLELLRDRTTDVAFTRSKVTDPDFESVNVAMEALLILVPDAHPLAARENVTPEDIHDEPIVHWSRSLGTDYVDSINAQIWGERTPNTVLELPEPEHLIRAVYEGRGIAVLGAHRAATIDQPGLTVVPFAEPAPQSTLSVTWLKSARNEPVIAAFRQAVMRVALADER